MAALVFRHERAPPHETQRSPICGVGRHGAGSSAGPFDTSNCRVQATSGEMLSPRVKDLTQGALLADAPSPGSAAA